MSAKRRVRTDQPTIVTLEEAMEAARAGAQASLEGAGFTQVVVVVNAAVSSHDPDDDHTEWAVGTRIVDAPKYRRESLRRSLEQSAEECAW